MARVTGRYAISSTTGEPVRAFVPLPLPPRDPQLALEKLSPLVEKAMQSLSRLEVARDLVPSLGWFIYGFVRKEAVLSSQIEGTQASLVDLLRYEANAETTVDDVEEVCNYLEALTYARGQLQSPKGLPISVRLLNETHRRLMKGVRGQEKRPGEIRTSQNWIGGTRPGNANFVPPPPEEVPGLLGQLENYIHKKDSLPPLIRAGLIHVQFETIHPYLDGNGRIGRLLITLLLEHWKLLSSPLLYLSLFFKRHRPQYYEHLNSVRVNGDWEGWLAFFLTGVGTIADEALATARDLFRIVADARERLLQSKKASIFAARLLEMLPARPIITAPEAVKALNATKPTAYGALGLLQKLGVLKEITGRQRGQAFAFAPYLDRLRSETET